MRSTNLNLAVSYPILNCIDSDKKSIFLPWADEEFKPLLKAANVRNKVLFWGYIDGRVDFDLVKYLALNCPDFVFEFVGPITDKVKHIADALEKSLLNVVFSGEQDLSEIDLSQFFCSIIPYKSGVADITAVTASNKTFRLLSYGLPLVTFGMPHFIECSVVFKSSNYEEVFRHLNLVNSAIYELQCGLAEMVSQNSEDSRYRFLVDAI